MLLSQMTTSIVQSMQHKTMKISNCNSVYYLDVQECHQDHDCPLHLVVRLALVPLFVLYVQVSLQCREHLHHL